ncbi:MAG: DUF3551 domain-containing protein [Xanthobacteraceae bacterium]
MKFLFFVAATFVAAAALGTPAQAQNYPWCANYSGHGGGGTNCGFTSFQQCMATVSGIGGFCDQNTQYRGSGRRRY